MSKWEMIQLYFILNVRIKCLTTKLNLDFNEECSRYDIGVHFKERILYSLPLTYTSNNSKIQ